MLEEGREWAIVLAGGQGSRLQSLTTTPSGTTIPKQFWSLTGGGSLLQHALQRAESVVSRQRVTVVVSEDHSLWWRQQLRLLPAINIVRQQILDFTHPAKVLGRIPARPGGGTVRDEKALSLVAAQAVHRSGELHRCMANLDCPGGFDRIFFHRVESSTLILAEAGPPHRVRADRINEGRNLYRSD